MSTVVVVCPHCGKDLKLRDRSKLGQKGKCPACAKAFVLQESAPAEEVQLELADSPIPVGKGAQWVPDEPAAARAPAGRGPAAGTAPVVSAISETTTIGTLGGVDAGKQRLKDLQRRRTQQRNRAVVLGGVTALVVAGVAWGFWAAFSGPAPEVVTSAGGVAAGSSGAATGVAAASPPSPTGAAPQTPGGVPASGATGGGASGAGSGLPGLPTVIAGPVEGSVILPHQEVSSVRQRRENATILERLVPRGDDAITLQMIPSGMNVVVHLRPALIWSDDPLWQEFRYSLTEDVTNWIAAQLKTHCRREPQQIEECLICLRLGATGTEPQVAAAVTFVQDARFSDLIEEFRGQSIGDDDSGPIVNVSSPFAFLVKDVRHVAIAPESDAFELSEVANSGNTNTTEGVYQFLTLSDRRRPFTVIFELDDVKRHQQALFSPATQPVFRQLLNWFGDDIETVAWSVDLNAESAVSEIFLRARSVSNSSRVATEILRRLEFLPRDLQAACLKMHPQTRGFQAIIGRFPAMLEVYRQATIPTVETRHVRLTTVLPRQAAPNLALGTLLAWDQSTQTDFSSSAPAAAVAAAAPAAADLPAKLEDRLRRTLEGEFNNPLQDAIAYIGNELQVPIDIDGNALKDAGFTKNMPIKLTLGKVTGLEALRAIILCEKCKPPVPEKRICIVIDEQAKRVLVSTEAFAQAAGQTIYPLVTP